MSDKEKENNQDISTIDMLKKVFKDDPQIRDYNNDNSSDNSTGIKKEIDNDSEKHIAIISSIFGVEEVKNENDNESSYKDWYNSLVKAIEKDENINIPKDMIKEIKE
jgi:hypothetical protein